MQIQNSIPRNAASFLGARGIKLGVIFNVRRIQLFKSFTGVKAILVKTLNRNSINRNQ